MIALLVSPNADPPRRSMLGLPIGLRAMFSAVDAGARRIEMAGRGAEGFRHLAGDSRLRVPCISLPKPRAGERLVVRADALVSPALLRDLELQEAIFTEQGQPVAARVSLDDDQDPLEALSAALPKSWIADRYRYAFLLERSRDFRNADKALLRSLVKPSDGPVSRHFNRHLSLAITRLLVPLGVTPYQMTVLVALAGLAAAWFASVPTWGMQLTGAALFQVHSVIDGCDGEIARLTRRFGRHGALVDSLVDDVCNLLFFVGLSVGVARWLEASWPLITGAVTALSYAAVAAVQYRGTQRFSRAAAIGRPADAPAAERGETAPGEGVVDTAHPFGDKTGFWGAHAVGPTSGSRLAAVFVALFRRDVFVVLILAAVALGLAPAVAAVFPLVGIGALVASVRQLTGSRMT